MQALEARGRKCKRRFRCSVRHDRERDHRVVERDRNDDQGVEDLVVSEHCGQRVRPPHRVDDGTHRGEHAAEPQQRQAR